jgi:FkbM family methyltransferase
MPLPYLNQKAKALVRRFLRSVGVDVMAYSPMRSHELRRAVLLRDRQIGLVVDGGAHKGEYAEGLRRLGYSGRMLSIEPLPGPFEHLQRAAAADRKWQCVNAALGIACGETTFYENSITQVSSLLPATGVVNTQGWKNARPLVVELRTVDSLLEGISWEGGLYIKLDVQGYEMQVLSGAGNAVRCASAIELELSTVELYQGSVLFADAAWQLQQLGFSLFSTEPALVDYQSARVLQLDCIFVKDTVAVAANAAAGQRT